MNFAVAMSGGTTPVINSTLAGVITGIKTYYPESDLYIPKPGIVGILNGDIWKMSPASVSEDLLDQIQFLPGSSLTGTTRVEKFDETQLKQFEETLKSLNITTFINIGGSGTIKQSKYLNDHIDGVDFIALPKTIDNDLGDPEFEKLLFTPGYLSSAQYLTEFTYSLIRENQGACYNDKVLIAQVFGRDTSFLAACTNLTGSDRVVTLFPEAPLTADEFLQVIKDKIDIYGGCVVIVPEGYPASIFDSNFEKEYDESGQVKWGSSHNTIVQIISSYLNYRGIGTRMCNPTIEQRQCISHIDSTDLDTAYMVGFHAISYHFIDERNFFVSIVNKEGGIGCEPIDLETLDISNFNRKFPLDWIHESKTKVNGKFKKYFYGLHPGERLMSAVDMLELGEPVIKKVNI